MARSRRSFSPRRGGRPNRGWSGLIEATYTTVAANSAVLLFTFTPSNPGIDLVILRTVGVVSVALDQSTSNENQLGGFGLIAVSDDAVAIGITAIPDPVSDIDHDGWFIYQAFSQQSGVSGSFMPSREYQFDSKAKRILPGEGITLAGVCANAHASQGLEVQVGLRILAQVRGTS